MSSTPTRPQNLDYGSVVDTNASSKDSPHTPKYTSPKYTGSSPNYTASSPPYVPTSPPIQQRHKNSDVSGGANENQDTFATEVLHIPGWATGFVLGGRTNKRLWDIIRRNGDIVDMVGEVTRYQSRNKGVFQVVTLCAEGKKTRVVDALRSVKKELVMTISKAKKMKRDGAWRDNRRHNEDDRRSSRRHEDDRRSRGRSRGRYEEDRRSRGRSRGRYEEDRRSRGGRYEEDRRSRGRYEDERRYGYDDLSYNE